MSEQKQIQSRVGKRPIPIPDGVDVKVDGRNVRVKGPKGELLRELPADVKAQVADKKVSIVPAAAGRNAAQFQGLARALVRNMIEGVANGYKLSLDFKGVGYRAEVKGRSLNMALGLSHPVHYELPESITVTIEIIDEGGIKNPRVHLSSHDKEVLGRTAARIRSFRPPEPYKGKGVRYTGERIREKAGKAGGAKG